MESSDKLTSEHPVKSEHMVVCVPQIEWGRKDKRREDGEKEDGRGAPSPHWLGKLWPGPAARCVQTPCMASKGLSE